MSFGRTLDPRWKAALVSVVLFLAGAVAGVSADRMWLGRWPEAAQAAPLTAGALSRDLNLSPDEQARVRSVLDSLQVEVSRALEEGPDSLRGIARRGRLRLEDALPPDRRGEFRVWMQGHHARMMQEMGGGLMAPGGRMGPGMMRGRGGGRGGMMGPDSPSGGRGGMRGGGMLGSDSAGGIR